MTYQFSQKNNMNFNADSDTKETLKVYNNKYDGAQPYSFEPVAAGPAEQRQTRGRINVQNKQNWCHQPRWRKLDLLFL